MISLGCPKNLVDSEVMLGQLSQHGYEICQDASEADVILINTCGFIQSAVEEGIDAIMEMVLVKEQAPDALLVVSGCMVQRYGDALRKELPEVDLFVGTESFHQIVASIELLRAEKRKSPALLQLTTRRYLMDSSVARRLSTPPHRAYLKVTEGCDNRCSYCLIPSIRGKQRSRPIEDLLREARHLEAGGVQELTLIAQDLTAYGTDLGRSGPRLADLLSGLVAETGIPWLRMLYLHPARLDEKVIRMVADQRRLTPYFDIPLQHISNSILKRMRRPYARQQATDLLARIRDILPTAAIRTTFMVGFPGETEEDLAQLEEFIASQRFDHLGVFAYSNEEGCDAAKLDGQVDEGTKQRRQERIMTRQAVVSQEKNETMIGTQMEVLIEGLSRETDLLLEGRTRRQAPEIDGCVYINEGEGKPGDLVKVRITEAHPYDLVGEII
ncbi:MAG: 30S ribosomal protein S12 methylthiotransferase RimO [Deltaproteobacteria bacterium]